MGIAVRELLALDYFREFYLLAGSGGLNKEIQGVTFLEAPDGTRWSRGKELIMSSGYAIAQEPDCIERAFQEGNMIASAFMIKRERYLKKIPERMIELFDEHDIPLISMPYGVAWMDVMEQINSAVINRAFRRFRLKSGTDLLLVRDLSFKEQKIQMMMTAVEEEMGFPAFLYDTSSGESYLSSRNFRRIANQYGLGDWDFIEPGMACTKHTLSDYMEMVRYRMIPTEENPQNPPVSWIQTPIVIDGNVQAYFIVMEARELLDYYDEFSIRVAFLMLHDLYEQVIASQELSNLGFENFIIGALESDVDQETLRRQASLRHLSLTDRYTCVLLRCSAAAGPSLQAVRTELLRAFRHSTLAGFCMLAITGENEAILFIKQDGGPISRNKVRALLRELHDAAAKSIPGLQVDMGGTLRGGTLAEVRSCVDRCRRALQRGSVVFPGRKLVFYEDLGPIAWLDIPGEELELMLRDFRRIMEEEKNIELLKTLQIYLQSNMNYSQTAEKMYVHINTIRKRLDKLSEIITLDLDDPVERLNTELLLQFLELQSGERGPAGDE